MKHLWEVQHPYYCEEGCHYARHRDVHTDYGCWAEFMFDNEDMDLDYNLLFRWDWHIENEDGERRGPSENKDERDGELKLRFMLQRKAAPWSCTIKVCQNDEPAVLEFLQRCFNHLAKLWEPLEVQHEDR